MSEKPTSNHQVTTSPNVTFNPNVPVVHSLHTNILLSHGWERNGSVYTKKGNQITYDGVWWTLNGEKRITFFEDIPKEIQ